MVTRGVAFEREYQKKQLAQGNHCERIAGSGVGRDSICDLVLFKDNNVYLVEVKSTIHKQFYTSTDKQKFKDLKRIALQHNAIPLLAVKFKRHGWVEANLTKGIPVKVCRPQPSGLKNQQKQTRKASD